MANVAGGREDPDVLVVGAGPTGLMAASLLVRSGLRVRIVDRGAGPARESRAFVVQARSMELFATIGLADKFLGAGVLATGARIHVEGRQAAELDFEDIGRTDTPYSFLLALPQAETERILAADLEVQGVRVERGVEVTGISQDEAGVTASLRDAAGAEMQARSAFLVGADGAHSVVRKALGLTFEGGAYEQSFLLADCRIEGPLDHGRLAVFLGRQNFAIYLPLRGRSLGRVIATAERREGEPAGIEQQGSGPAALDEVEAAFRQASGLDLALYDPAWVSRYRIHHRAVDHYGRGRAFVAGDAAHIHSPAGGQGMNTGLQDAANLAWKLAAVLNGSAPPALLDSYHSERWPVGQKLLAVTDRLFERMTSQSGWSTRVRNALIPVLAGTISRFMPARARAFRFVSQLGIRYRPGAFVVDAAPDWDEAPRPGARAPNAAVQRGLDVFALTAGYRFHVLALSRRALSEEEVPRLSAEIAALPAPLGLQAHLIAASLIGRDPRLIRAESGEVFAAYGIGPARPEGLFLVRPDGYVAWRADRLDIASLGAFLRERFWTAG